MTTRTSLQLRLLLISVFLFLSPLDSSSPPSINTTLSPFNGYGAIPNSPLWGSSGQPFLTILPQSFNSLNDFHGRIGARNLSNMIAAATRYKYSSNSITELLNIWGFAVAIDISQSAASINRSCPLNIPVPPGDSTFFYTSNLPFFRLNINLSLSILDPQINPQTLGFANTNFTNFATSFIDCSILYGLSSSSAIRAYTGGLLSSQILAEDNGEYPLYDKATGFFKYPTATPNHLPSLNAIYILLLREHNRMAKYYSNLYPNATDEQLFQKSRRWVISVVQKITFEQYIPVLTGAPLSNYTGYNQSTNPCMSLYASFVGMRYGHSSTSSFITRLESDGMTPCSSGPISLYEATFNVACFSESGGGGIESILRGMIAELDKTAGLNLVDDLRNRLLNVNNFTDNQPNDLLAIDVQRCRDVGMPSYNEMRLAHGLTSYTTFSNITSNRSIQQLLAIIYNNDINRVEAYVGSFAEDPAYPWYNLGPLLSTGIREQFTRIRNGDPFFFRNEGVLDALEAEMISHMSIGDLIMLNTKITNVSNNAFVKTLVKGNSSSSSINGNQSNYPTNSISFTPDFVMQWIISPDNTTISFNITSNYTGWFSIGFGETMNQMDMIMIVNEGGIWTPYDCHSTTPFIPSIDTAQNIINYTTVTGSGSGNITSKSLVPAMVSFSRLLNTGDPNDMIISPSDTSVPLSYAYYNIPNGKSYYHNPYQRGVVHVNLFSKAQVYNISLTDSGGGTSNNPASLWVHAIGMSIYFIVAYPIGIFYSRYYRNMGSWLTKHQTAMSLIITSTVMSAIQPILSQSFILNRHTITGYTLICLVLVMAFTGVTSRFLSPRYNKFATRISEMNRSFHKNMGMLIYSLGITNGYFGWSDFAILNSPVVSDQSPNIYLAFAIIVPLSIFTYGEYITGTFSRYGFVQQGSSSKNSSRRTTINNMHLPEFSWSDIEKRIRSGRKWLVIEGVIYDVDSIIPNHPGGGHVISTMIGRDATKEFNGEAFSISAPKSNITSGFKLLDSNNSIFPVFERKHDHSRFARFQLLSNAIGVVKTVGEVNLLAAASSGHDLNISNHSISGGRVDGGAAGVYSSRMLLPSDASHIKPQVSKIPNAKIGSHLNLTSDIVVGETSHEISPSMYGERVDGGAAGVYSSRMLLPSDASYIKPQVSKIPNAKIGSRLNLTSDIVVVETSQEISPDTATIQTMHTSNDSSSSPKRTIAVAKSSLQQNIILKSSTSRSDLSNLVQLNDEEYQYQILEKSLLSTSTSADRKVYLLKVSLKASYDVLLAPPNSSIMFKFKANDGSVIQRAYTPIYHVNRGNVEFIIKFINGKMTSHLALASSINMIGPKMEHMCLFKTPSADVSDNLFTTIGLVCGGTGITPIFQILDFVLQLDASHQDIITSIHMLNVNQTPHDLFGNNLLDSIKERMEGRLFVNNFVHFLKDISSDTWGEFSDTITEEVVWASLPPPETKNMQIIICGPPELNTFFQKLLPLVGYPEEVLLIL